MRLLVVEDEKSLRDDITKSCVWTAMKQTHAAMEMKPASCLPLSVTTWSCLISTCPARTE